MTDKDKVDCSEVRRRSEGDWHYLGVHKPRDTDAMKHRAKPNNRAKWLFPSNFCGTRASQVFYTGTYHDSHPFFLNSTTFVQAFERELLPRCRNTVWLSVNIHAVRAYAVLMPPQQITGNIFDRTDRQLSMNIANCRARAIKRCKT